MTKEEIIELAVEAGFDEHHAKFDLRIESFAELVVSAEREACALIAEEESMRGLPDEEPKGKHLKTALTQIACGNLIAHAIRTRGQE